MVAKLSVILFKSQFKNLYLRKVMYLILGPVMAGYLGSCLLLNSYSFLFVSVICYFFVLDAIAIPGPGIIADISRFYYIPKSMINVYVDYILYRLLNSFVFSYVPALLVFFFMISSFPQEVSYLPVKYSVLIFSCAWVLYVFASVPMLVLAFRKKAFYQLYSLFAIPFFSIGIILQLEINWKLIIVQDYLVFVWIIIAIVFIAMGFAFIRLLNNEDLYPETKNGKLGFK